MFFINCYYARSYGRPTSLRGQAGKTLAVWRVALARPSGIDFEVDELGRELRTDGTVLCPLSNRCGQQFGECALEILVEPGHREDGVPVLSGVEQALVDQLLANTATLLRRPLEQPCHRVGGRGQTAIQTSSYASGFSFFLRFSEFQKTRKISVNLSAKQHGLDLSVSGLSLFSLRGRCFVVGVGGSGC